VSLGSPMERRTVTQILKDASVLRPQTLVGQHRAAIKIVALALFLDLIPNLSKRLRAKCKLPPAYIPRCTNFFKGCYCEATYTTCGPPQSCALVSFPLRGDYVTADDV
jgi:hypothetical protein